MSLFNIVSYKGTTIESANLLTLSAKIRSISPHSTKSDYFISFEIREEFTNKKMQIVYTHLTDKSMEAIYHKVWQQIVLDPTPEDSFKVGKYYEGLIGHYIPVYMSKSRGKFKLEAISCAIYAEGLLLQS